MGHYSLLQQSNAQHKVLHPDTHICSSHTVCVTVKHPLFLSFLTYIAKLYFFSICLHTQQKKKLVDYTQKKKKATLPIYHFKMQRLHVLISVTVCRGCQMNSKAVKLGR